MARWLPLHFLLASLAGALPAQGQLQDLDPPPEPIQLKLTEACMLRIAEGQLALDSRLRGMRIPRQEVKIEDLDGTTYMELRPGNFRFNHFQTDYSLSIDSRGDRIGIEFTGRDWSIRYSQSGDNPNGFGYKQAGITIYDVDGSYKASVSASDFASLRKEHPVEVMQYLAPVLRSMHVRNFFTDPGVARQVFASPPAGKSLEPELKALLQQLDSDSFRQRNAAHSRLAALAPASVEFLEKCSRSDLSPQQLTEIDAFLHARISSDRREQLRHDPDYLLDCLYCEDAQVRSRSLALLNREFKADLKLNPNEDLLPHAAAIEAARARLKPASRPAE